MRARGKRKPGLPIIPKIDQRLLGTWKSDNRRTLAEWTWKKNFPPEKKARFAAIFGKMEIKYTRAKVFWALRKRKWEQSRRYKILAVDENKVAIIEYGDIEIKHAQRYGDEVLALIKEFNSKPEIRVINFDGNHYWVSLGNNGKNREFFRKISSRD